MKQTLLAICSVFLGSLFVAYGIVSSNWLMIALAVSVPFLIAFLLHEHKNSQFKKSFLFLITILILGLPFYRLFIGKYPDQIWQIFAFIIFILIYFSLNSQEKNIFFQKFKTLFLCWLYCIPIFLLPILQSENITREDIFFLASILVMPIFFLIPSMIINNKNGMFSCFRLLLAGGIIQSIVIILQAGGIFDHLPGLLGRLDTTQWGGNILNSSGLVRLPGSFLDYELVAEYLGIMVILSWGLLLTKVNNNIKKISLLCFIVSGIAGILTGTRGFIFGAAFGVFVLVFINRRGFGNLRYLLFPLVGLAVFAIILFLIFPLIF